MKTRHEELPFSPAHPLCDELFTDNSIFFDIETTGFSPKHTGLYLIGCIRRKNDLLCMDQFFAEAPEEEKLILTAFLELLSRYHTIITYNGIGFDIPYLKAKCGQYDLSEHFSEYDYIDIFKSISTMKHIFRLENYKQKSIEQFLHISRNDLYNGGELIPIYQSYTKTKDSELLELLLLHNYEDVLGMLDLIPILSYVHLFHGGIAQILTAKSDTARTYDGSDALEYTITFQPEYPIPEHISYRLDDIYLSGKENRISLVIRMYEGSLKYFYPNYKDYYYLPEEDMAMHKSVAAYVEKDHRRQAKAADCYTKKEGLFLPQYNTSFVTPAFRRSYEDKLSYFEYTDDFDKNPQMINGYARHLLNVLGSKKPKHS